MESMISDGVRASEVVWGLRGLLKKSDSAAVLARSQRRHRAAGLAGRARVAQQSGELAARTLARAACGARRPGSVAAGHHQSGDQRDPVHGIRHRPPRELLIRSCQGEDDQVLIEVRDDGVGIDPEQYASAVQCLLHHQAQRDGNGIVDLPFDHRGARGANMGVVQRWARCDVCVHSAASPGDGVVIDLHRCGIRACTERCLVLVIGGGLPGVTPC